MNELITLSVETLAILLLIAMIPSTIAGMFLMSKYVRTRGIKTKASKELQRLDRYVVRYHPEAVRDAPLVDIVIELMRAPQPKEKWRTE